MKTIIIGLFAFLAIASIVKAVKSKNKSYKEYANTEVYKQYGCAYPHEVCSDHIIIGRGNSKLGKDVWHFDMLSGDGIHTLKNGVVLTNVKGTCSGCCSGCKGCCYAIRDEKQYVNALKIRVANTHIMYTDMARGFAEIHDFIMKRENNKRIKVKVRKFRIHESGEFFSLEYMRAWFDFAEAHPFVQFYCYTKRFDWLETVYKERGFRLHENLSVNVSIWHNNYSNPYHFSEYIYDDSNLTGDEPIKAYHCDCSGGTTCGSCNRCVFAKQGCKTACLSH